MMFTFGLGKAFNTLGQALGIIKNNNDSENNNSSTSIIDSNSISGPLPLTGFSKNKPKSKDKSINSRHKYNLRAKSPKMSTRIPPKATSETARTYSGSSPKAFEYSHQAYQTSLPYRMNPPRRLTRQPNVIIPAEKKKHDGPSDADSSVGVVAVIETKTELVKSTSTSTRVVRVGESLDGAVDRALALGGNKVAGDDDSENVRMDMMEVCEALLQTPTQPRDKGNKRRRESDGSDEFKLDMAIKDINLGPSSAGPDALNESTQMAMEINAASSSSAVQAISQRPRTRSQTQASRLKLKQQEEEAAPQVQQPDTPLSSLKGRSGRKKQPKTPEVHFTASVIFEPKQPVQRRRSAKSKSKSKSESISAPV
ncbi:hypothetical protein CVT24_011660 [Panaeolus cyanescens]|uniref:Uncharacterized protein n=1 Tax=Panaeolus cyanescens TaxID=181874 RepID=A0A409YH22_9AGAR|nr:hypothetical protein CVT24_011660 [Panaeolus cyanescens]